MFLLMGEAFKSLPGKVGKVADCLAGEKKERKDHYIYFMLSFPVYPTSEIHVMQKTFRNLE